MTKTVQPSPIIPAILVAASAVSVMTTDLYSPSLPHLPAIFDTDAATVQHTMMFNLLGYALGQLVHGPLSERYGRRPVMIGGMAAAVVFSLACALAWSIEALIVARTLQGLAVCAEAVIALAVIRDVYDGPSGARIMAVIGMAIAIVPAIAPLIGGFVPRVAWMARQFLSADGTGADRDHSGLAIPAGNDHAGSWRTDPEADRG